MMDLSQTAHKALAALVPHKSAGTSMTQLLATGAFDSKAQCRSVLNELQGKRLVTQKSNNYWRITDTGKTVVRCRASGSTAEATKAPAAKAKPRRAATAKPKAKPVEKKPAVAPAASTNSSLVELARKWVGKASVPELENAEEKVAVLRELAEGMPLELGDCLLQTASWIEAKHETGGANE